MALREEKKTAVALEYEPGERAPKVIASGKGVLAEKIIDVAKESLIIELTGNQDKIEAFMSLLSGYEILELARTGITGLKRGIKDVTYID